MTANAAATGAASTGDVSPRAVPGITAEQVQQILTLLDAQKAGNEQLQGKMEWLYNSGASCHMTGVFEVLQSVKK